MSEKISPSKFMKELRPEYYSDTEDRVSYALEAPTFEYFLESLTSRNQMHAFELFARKLCERTICPNLRPQTGPEGGGDGKVDSETYPVADEIALTYVSEPNAGREKWAFAFSTKAKWKEKITEDVKGIVETGRHYDRIICVTSRFAKSKDRLECEEELSKKYKIPVSIHDRSWIIKEVIEDDRKDLAFNYLGIGESKSDPMRLGPVDYSRARQLMDIEKQLEDADAFRGMEGQRAAEALVAAKLSRNLESPRTETDSRFLRAIRLAKADGTYRQQLEADYEHIWTAFWWFDDFKFLNDAYDTFEAFAIQTDHAKNLEFLCNLRQLLVNSIVHGHMSAEECRLNERTDALTKVLQPLAANPDRPNNRLEAQTLLLIIRLGSVFVQKSPDELPPIWREFEALLEKAAGLGEFDATRLVSMIELAGDVAGNDPAYNNLIEKLAEFVSKRKSETEGALVLLKRAQKLDFADRLDMIRLLGKAAVKLNKKESQSQLIEALQLLTLAYRGAGLLWAARASCFFAAALIFIEGEEESLLPVSLIPMMKIWAWIALELRHLPDILFAIEILNGSLVSLPLTEESKAQVREDVQELEYALASLFLNLSDEELKALDRLPDILEGLGLFVARTALLFTLGYAEKLREDGSLPKQESDDEVTEILSVLASQPIAREIRGPMTLNAEGHQALSTTILGMTLEIATDGRTHSILAAEAAIGVLEAFFATATEQRVVPHTEKLQINVIQSGEISSPSIEINAMDLSATLTWPAGLSPAAFEKHADIQRFFLEFSGRVLAATCMMVDSKAFLQSLVVDEAVQHRVAMIIGASNSYHRLARRSISRITDWDKAVGATYPPLSPRPKLPLIDLKEAGSEEDKAQNKKPEEGGKHSFPAINDHRAMSICSVIDAHAWDVAAWSGTAYAQIGPLPAIAFMFKNREAAKKIFEHWHERFGQKDKDEEIYLAIVRHLPGQDPHHYVILITSKFPEESEREQNKAYIVASRSMTMEPQGDVNLNSFLKGYQKTGAFLIMPAVVTNAGELEFLSDLAILKCAVSIREVADIAENDIEAMALTGRSYSVRKARQT